MARYRLLHGGHDDGEQSYIQGEIVTSDVDLLKHNHPSEKKFELIPEPAKPVEILRPPVVTSPPTAPAFVSSPVEVPPPNPSEPVKTKGKKKEAEEVKPETNTSDAGTANAAVV
jgi:hypothetical protein